MEIIKAAACHLESVYELVCELENERLHKDDFARIYEVNLHSKDIHYILAVQDADIIGFGSRTDYLGAFNTGVLVYPAAKFSR